MTTSLSSCWKGKMILEEAPAPTEISDLPDHLLTTILLRVPHQEKQHVSLVCRKWYDLDRVVTERLTVGSKMVPAKKALAAIASRFPNLTRLNILYARGHDRTLQVDDECLRCVVDGFEHLTELALVGCENVSNAGLEHLARSPKLKAVGLNRMHDITGKGLLSLLSGCPSLRLFHVEHLGSVRELEWLEFIGLHGHIENLSIRECPNIPEMGLAKLGPRGWRNLREFYFSYCRRGRFAIPSELNGWKFDGPEGTEYCPNLEVLSLTHCTSIPGTGTLWILAQCKELRHVEICCCPGVQDREMRMLTRNNPQISSIVLRPRSTHSRAIGSLLTDGMLRAIAENCRCLQSLKLISRTGHVGADQEVHSLESGMVALLQRCTQLKALSLTSFSNCNLGTRTMTAIGRSTSLEELEFVACDFLTDEMLRHIGPSVTRLNLTGCVSLTDECLNSRPNLAYLQVYNISSISKEAVLRAATVVKYWHSDHEGNFDSAFKGTPYESAPEEAFVQLRHTDFY